jgi:hypothetical protein
MADVTRGVAQEMTRNWARDWGLKSIPTWLVDFAAVEIASSGRAGTRAVIAHSSLYDSAPHCQLLKASCRLSLHPNTTSGGTSSSKMAVR